MIIQLNKEAFCLETMYIWANKNFKKPLKLGVKRKEREAIISN